MTVVGALGVLIRGRRTGLVHRVRPLIDNLITQGFRLDPALYHDTLRLAGEEG